MKCLIYVTKSKPWLFFDKSINYYSLSNKIVDNDLNGKIVASSDYEVEEVMTILNKLLVNVLQSPYTTNKLSTYYFLKRSCLKKADVDKYKPNYAIHIKKLYKFIKPKELKDLYVKGSHRNPEKMFTDEIQINGEWFHPMERTPQNMCYAYDKYGNKYVLISIRPEWACKILNGEKTIEVRKKVLNCMKGD